MATQALTIKLGLDGLSSVQAGLRGINASAASAVSGLTRLAGPVVALVAAAGGLASVAAGFKHIIDEGSRLNDLNLRTGASIKSLIRFSEVFREAGKTAEDVGPAFDRAAKAIFAAATEGGPAAAALARLGLSASELSAQAPEVQFERLGLALSKVANPTERAALAIRLFGKSGADLLPVFDAFDQLSSVDGALGKLPDVLGRNVKILDAVGDSFTALKLKGTQLFAGLADQLAGTFEPALKALTQIDLTAAGQSIGAFINVYIDAWNDGGLTELIADTIEAGFEIAGNLARKAFSALSAFFGKVEFWNGLTLAIVTATNEGLKLLGKGIVSLGEFIAKELYESVRVYEIIFVAVLNVIGKKFEELANASAAIAATVLNIPVVPKFKFEPLKADIVDGIKNQIGKNADATRGVITSFFDNSTNAARSLIGVPGEVGDNVSATNKLAASIKRQLVYKEEEEILRTIDQIEDDITASVRQQLPLVNVMLGLLEAEHAAKRKLAALDAQRAALEADFSKTNAQKFDERSAILAKERAELVAIIKLLHERADAAQDQDPVQAEQIRTRADSFQNQLSGVQAAEAQQGPDPHSVTEQIVAASTDLQNQFGTVAQSIASSFKDVIGVAVDSVSAGLQKLIGDTEYWSSKLGKIGGAIMGAITAAISKMVVQFAVGLLLQATLGKVVVKAALKDAATLTTAWTPAAVAASIATEGSAAGVGLAAFLAASAAGIGAAAGASAGAGAGSFAGGGYTGHGGISEPAGVVHGQEYVFDAAAVNRIGVPRLDAIRLGPANSAPAESGGGSGPGVQVNLAAFDTRLDGRRWAESQDAETWFVDMAGRTAHRWRRS